MKYLFFLGIISCVFASESILLRPSVSSSNEIALIWIVGAGSQTESYKKLALETQKQAAARGVKLWIHLPAFYFDYPKPLEIDAALASSIKTLHSSGFPEGNKVFIAAHSLGTVMSQIYVQGDDFKTGDFKA